MEATDLLRRLADAHGVATEYVDASGQQQVATAETLVAVLDGLGVRTHDPARARRSELQRHWSQIVDPVAVARAGHGDLLLRLPESQARARVDIEIALEAGGTLRTRSHANHGHVVERWRVATTDYVAVRIALPGPLPLGYHHADFTVNGPAGAFRGSAFVLSAPSRTYQPRGTRAFGIFAPVYALRSDRNDGIGDLGDLARLARWAGAQGASTVATLPLLAAFLDGPVDISPYAPASRLAWNELYLDLQTIPDWADCEEARALLASPRAAAERRRLRARNLVDPAAVFALRKPALRALARHAFAQPRRRAVVERFAAERPELVDYAQFRAAVTSLGPSWYDWPAAARSGRLRERDYDPEESRAHLYAQLCMHEQLTALRRSPHISRGPYLDFPLGVHGAGFDPWRERESFALELSTGAPPDLLFTGGQDWGIPPLHPATARATGYRHFIAALHNHMRYAGVLRIDHVMALHRLYVVPHGASAREGAYVRYAADELWAIVAIESRRARTQVVGEDLGTVPEAVRSSMRVHGVSGLHVVQFAVAPDAKVPVQPAPPASVASLNTHDLPTFAGWLRGDDVRTMRRLGLLDAGRARAEHARRRREVAALDRLPPHGPDAPPLQRVLRWLGRSDADLVIVAVDDILGSPAPHNVPGTTDEHPNWRRRLPLSLEALEASRDARQAVRLVRAGRKSTSNRPPPVAP